MNALLEIGNCMVKLAQNFGPNFAVTFVPNSGGGIKLSVIIYVDVNTNSGDDEADTIQINSDYIFGSEDTMPHKKWVEDVIKSLKQEMIQLATGAPENARDNV